MQTLMDTEKNRLIKKFHTLLGRASIGQEGKEAILSGYGVNSTKELNAYELLEACNKLNNMANPKLAELDRARRRLIASIFSWREAMGCTTDIEGAKKIARRASGVEDFNKIPLERLRSLYYAFNKKVKDIDTVNVMTSEKIKQFTTLN